MKHFFQFLVAAFAALSCSVPDSLSDLVYPQMDSAHSRWAFFASACRPFGMVALSPDTDEGDDWMAGYRYDSPEIQGFSHIHCWQISGLSVMPVTFDDEPDSLFASWSSPFSHERELAQAGYHKVFLDRYGIQVELTSTQRTGFHKYTFDCENHKGRGVLLNLNSQVGPCLNTLSSFKRISDSSFEGMVVSEATYRRPKPFNVYFRIDVDKPVSEVITDEDSGNKMLRFNDGEKEVQMKVALSFTSEENAGINLETENPGWDFLGIVADSKAEWSSMLSRIEVKGGSEIDRRRFYTDLWHVLLGKHTISDVNGYYPDNMGECFEMKRLPLDDNGNPRFRHFNTDGFWGGNSVFDNIWELVYPDIAYEHVMSLVQYYKDGGLIPRGPSGANYSYVMTGDCSCPFIVSAIQKGIVSEDLEYIYEALKKNHEPGGIMEKTGYEHFTSTGGGFPYYLSMGYVPFPNPEKSRGYHQQGAGLTLQYAYEDYALAQLALKLGKEEDYERYMSRSSNYKNVFDPETGWMRPKNADGVWMEPFDPFELADSGFIEASAAQATWFVPHDGAGLAELMGGKDKAAAKLNGSMEKASELDFTSGKNHNVETFPEYKRIPINYGNQPSIHTAFMFHAFDRPDLSQYWSRRIVRAVYSKLSPYDGYNGDEDQGSMSCLAVAMKIGLFQVDGGVTAEPFYQIGSPVFDEITLHLTRPDKTCSDFTIICKGGSDEDPVVKSMSLNGTSYNKSTISHEEIMKGGRLVLEF